MKDNFEASAQQKAADITLHLLQGGEPTTAEVAQRYDTTWQGAYLMMCRISAVIPIIQEGGRWRMFDSNGM